MQFIGTLEISVRDNKKGHEQSKAQIPDNKRWLIGNEMSYYQK